MRRLGGLIVMLAATAAPLVGQRSALREVRDGGSAGLTFVVAQPLGDFRRHGDVAVGLTGFAVAGRTLGLRMDGAYFLYDSDYRGYGVSTTSSIGTFAIGPQLTLGQDPVRLYGFGTVGGTFFWSSANYETYCGCSYYGDSFFIDGDFTTTAQVGAGVLLTVSRRRTPVAIDFGIRGVRHAQVQYVPAGGITDNGDGTFTVDRVETPVEMRVFQIGVSVGLR